jgi:hypothetical protein
VLSTPSTGGARIMSRDQEDPMWERHDDRVRAVMARARLDAARRTPRAR